ncbi:MAG TPA: adenylate/guanylate cyclase domain-containing protein [Gemmataceae bacterium]|nr:adenylate/guanylate cyclase domain-containing protein [Gemmataceae bacterium]
MTGPTAADLLEQALRAERLGHFKEARDHLRQAGREADSPLHLDVCLRLGQLLVRGGPPCYEEAEAVLTNARRRADAQSSQPHAAAAVHLLALLHYHRGRADDALRLLEQSPARDQAGPAPEAARLFHYRGLIAAGTGQLDEAEQLLFRAHQTYQQLGHDAGLAEVCDSLANLLLQRGKTRAALQFADRSLALKRKLGDRYGEAISLGTKGRSELRLARYDDARRSFTADLGLARELDDERGVGVMLNCLGEVALLQNDPAAAAALFRENRDADHRGPLNAFYAELGLARAHLAAGRLPDAEAAAGRLDGLLERFAELRDLGEGPDGLRGALAWRRGDFDGGALLLRRAVDGLRRKGHALDTIPWLHELRDLHQRQGLPARAVAVMSDALDLWGECGSQRGVKDVEDWLRTVDQPSLVRLALERHLPAPLVQDVLNGKLVPREPRVQRLAVLFCDLRDYTALAERTAPAEVVELLNEWFSEATRAVRRHGGLVDKFIGDAVMALFGVPDERDDAAADAVRAALALRDALAALNLRQEALGGPTLRAGIGIDTGEAVVGFLGSHLRQSYTAIGDVVNTASRLEGATKDFGCDVLISDRAHAGQQRYGVAETACLGRVRVKGRQREVVVHKVLGPRGPER